MANVDPTKPPVQALKVIQSGEQAPSNTTANTYYLIRYDCPVGPVQSVVAEWRVIHGSSTLTGSFIEKYKYEGNNVVRPRAPDFLANELKTCDLGATTETELQLNKNYRVEHCVLLVAVYSKTFPTTEIKCLPDSGDLLTTTINMASIFINIMVGDGLSGHGPWKSDIRELALKIQNEVGMCHYFMNVYGPKMCPTERSSLAIIETFLHKTLVPVNRTDWKQVAHVYGNVCKEFRIEKEVSEAITASLQGTALDEKRRAAYLQPLL
ncbi:hypothetical protein AJ78_00812 [Emergomyces pasteurianus Ep9510]|uniref:Uncharacterized protein n=1 Tax=Emergomyces pasteurianus Ep9510 TaxID=1447872 RepID=A0A1J9QSM0_9EURO|nr:hypothetical protein AJ78_00812 [Emergomyces pasteurianus Ep9510]